MVIGGSPSLYYDNIDSVEEVKTNSILENECPAPNTFPVKIRDAVGANMSEDNQLLFP